VYTLRSLQLASSRWPNAGTRPIRNAQRTCNTVPALVNTRAVAYYKQPVLTPVLSYIWRWFYQYCSWVRYCRTDLRGLHTRMCCLRLTHVRHGRKALRRSEYNSLDFGSGVKIPIVKLNCDDISKGKTLRFFPLCPIWRSLYRLEIEKISTFLKYI